MGIFNQKSKFKPAPPTIRKEVVVVDVAKSQGLPKPRRTPAPSLKLPIDAPRSSLGARESASPYPLSSDEPRLTGKRKLGVSAHRPSPVRDSHVTFDHDSGSDDDDWEAAVDTRKRQRRAFLNGRRRADPSRILAHPALRNSPASEGASTSSAQLPMIHAVEVASLALRCVPVLGAVEDEVAVELQYPGWPERERYELVWGKEKIDAVKDIKRVVRCVADMYLTDDEAAPFLDQTNGIVRQLERASSDKVRDLGAFKFALGQFNDRLRVLYEDGFVATNLSQRHDVPSHVVSFILDQVYDRTVAPKVELLRKYENGSDNVYGELLHQFVSDILVNRISMTSDQVFVDLGSGVGNVVLQAALEIGCESWGCEMMENACNLAEDQHSEFAARCRLWGLAPGEVHLQRGDFRVNVPIQEALKRADVVLVNNQAFTSQLNDDLVRMFLDLKAGCKVVSLKTFVHDHKSASHNINDVGSTILDVEDLTYPQGYVSWTGAAGTFCISTRRK